MRLDLNNKKRVTLEDVARKAGVSRATASLVVRNSNLVSDKTREKVYQAISDLEYVYDRQAANFRSGKSSTVGVIITHIDNPFFTELMSSLQLQLDRLGYTVLLGMSFESELKQRKIIDSMLEHRVCGIIMSPVAHTGKEVLDFLNAMNVPVVLLGRDVNGAAYDFVGTDDFIGTKIATSYLIDQGHKRIAFLGGVAETTPFEARLAGFRKALMESDLREREVLSFNTSPSREGGVNGSINIIQKHPDVTAIVCHNDIIAIGAITGVTMLGLTPGKDVSLIGIDNISETNTSNPALTTISINIELWGVSAAQLLHKRLTNNVQQDFKRIIIDPELVARNSVKTFY